MNFSTRLDRFEEEIFASLNEKRLALEAEGKTIYNLSVGTPDFETPLPIREAFTQAAMDPANWKYALRDTPELLQAVCDYYQKRYGVSLTPDMIASCYGSEEGMGHIGLALLDEGDTVLLPSPCYPVFISGARMAGGDIYYYPMTEETNYLPKVSQIPPEVARKAKYMIVSLPSNPTGSVATPENYQEIIAFAKEYDILIIHDNAYSDIIFDGKKGASFLSYPGALDIGVEFFSLSKSFNVTGARISFCIGRRDVIDAFKKLRSQIDFGMFIPMQKAAIAALTMPSEEILKAQCHHYEERRDTLCGGLRNIGWPVSDSHGSMFVWAKIPIPMKSMAFCTALMEKSGVICTPGESFGPLGEGYVRFALTMPPEKIKKALEAIDSCGILKK